MTMTTAIPAAAPVTTPLEPTTPIKPSEALRLGRLVRPLRTPYEALHGDDGACANGAMAIGWGYAGDSDIGAFMFAKARLDHYDIGVWAMFDAVENRGEDGDAAVLAFLEERGL